MILFVCRLSFIIHFIFLLHISFYPRVVLSNIASMNDSFNIQSGPLNMGVQDSANVKFSFKLSLQNVHLYHPSHQNIHSSGQDIQQKRHFNETYLICLTQRNRLRSFEIFVNNSFRELGRGVHKGEGAGGGACPSLDGFGGRGDAPPLDF